MLKFDVTIVVRDAEGNEHEETLAPGPLVCRSFREALHKVASTIVDESQIASIKIERVK